jgi:hypothetical protein
MLGLPRDDPVTGYQCWYRDNEGNQYVDFYDSKGGYTGTG